MAKVTIKIDDKAFKKQLNNIVKYTEDAMVDIMVEVYRENTPIGGPPPAGTKCSITIKHKKKRQQCGS